MDFKSGPHSEGETEGEGSEVRASNEHDIAAAQRRHGHQGVPEGNESSYRARLILFQVSRMHNNYKKMILFGTP